LLCEFLHCQVGEHHEYRRLDQNAYLFRFEVQAFAIAHGALDLVPEDEESRVGHRLVLMDRAGRRSSFAGTLSSVIGVTKAHVGGHGRSDMVASPGFQLCCRAAARTMCNNVTFSPSTVRSPIHGMDLPSLRIIAGGGLHLPAGGPGQGRGSLDRSRHAATCGF